MNRNIPINSVPCRTTSSHWPAAASRYPLVVRRQMPQTPIPHKQVLPATYRQMPGPAGTSRQMPAGTSRQMPAGTSRQMPAGTSRQMPGPSGTSRQMPAGTSRQMPGPLEISREIPLEILRQKASATYRQMPGPAIVSRYISSETSRQKPSATSRQMPGPLESSREMPSEICRQMPLAASRHHPTVVGPSRDLSDGRAARPLSYKFPTRSDETMGNTVHDYQHGSVNHPQLSALVDREQTSRSQIGTESAQRMSSEINRRERYPYLVANDTGRRERITHKAPINASRREEMTFIMASDANKRETSSYMMPSDGNKRGKLSYLVPSDANKRETSSYMVLSNPRKREKSSYMMPSDANKRETSSYMVLSNPRKRETSSYMMPSDGNKRGKLSYMVPSDASKRETSSYMVPSDASKRETSSYMMPSDGNKRGKLSYMVPSDTNKRDKMAYMADDTFLVPSANSMKEKNDPSETSRRSKSSYMAVGDSTQDKATTVVLRSNVHFKGTSKLQDLYLTDAVVKEGKRDGSKISGTETTVQRQDRWATSPAGSIDVPHFLMYDGKSQWAAFHMKFQIYARRENWKGHELLDRLCFCLTDAASEYFASCLEKIPGLAYKELVDKFKKRFDMPVPGLEVDIEKESQEKLQSQKVSPRYAQIEPTPYRQSDQPYREVRSSRIAHQQCISSSSSRSISTTDDRHYQGSLSSGQRKLPSSPIIHRAHSSAKQLNENHPGYWQVPTDQKTYDDDITDDGSTKFIGRTHNEDQHAPRSRHSRSSSLAVKRSKSIQVNDDPGVWKAPEDLYSPSYPRKSPSSYQTNSQRSEEKHSVKLIQFRSPGSLPGHRRASHGNSEDHHRSSEKSTCQSIAHDRKRRLSAVRDRALSAKSRRLYDRTWRRNVEETSRTSGVERVMSALPISTPNVERSHSARHVVDRGDRRTEKHPQVEYCRRVWNQPDADHRHASPRILSRGAHSQGIPTPRHAVSSRSVHTDSASSERWERIRMNNTNRRFERHQSITKEHAHHGEASTIRNRFQEMRSGSSRQIDKKFPISVFRAKAVADKYASLDIARRDRDNMKRGQPETQTRSRMAMNRTAVPTKSSTNQRYSSGSLRKHAIPNQRSVIASSRSRNLHLAAQPQKLFVTITKKASTQGRGSTHFHPATGNKPNEDFHRQHVSEKSTMSNTSRMFMNNPNEQMNSAQMRRSNKPGPLCIVEGCDFRPRHLRVHVIMHHFPQCFHDDFMNSRLLQVEGCLQWMCEKLLGKGNKLRTLMEYVNQRKLIRANFSITAADRRQAEMMSKQLSEPIVSEFTLMPLRSTAMLCHWRVVGSLLNLLNKVQKTDFRTMLGVLPSTSVRTLKTYTGGMLATKEGKIKVDKIHGSHKATQNRIASTKLDKLPKGKSPRNFWGSRNVPNKTLVKKEMDTRKNSIERKRHIVASEHQAETEMLSGKTSSERKIAGSPSDCKRMKSNNSTMIPPLFAKKRKVDSKMSSTMQSKHSPSSVQREKSTIAAESGQSQPLKIRSISELKGIDLSEFQIVDEIDEEIHQQEDATKSLNTHNEQNIIKKDTREKLRERNTNRNTLSKTSTEDSLDDFLVVDELVEVLSVVPEKSSRQLRSPSSHPRASVMEELEDLDDLDGDAFVVVDEDVEVDVSLPTVAGEVDVAAPSADACFVVLDEVSLDVTDLSQCCIVDEVGEELPTPSPDGPEGDDDNDFSQFNIIDEA